MAALAASERGMHSLLLGVLERGRMLPPEEIRELRAAASRTAATMAATAGEVVSMERAATQTPGSHSYLAPTIDAFTAQLNAGVRQYNEWPPPQRNCLVSQHRFDVELADVAAALPRRTVRRHRPAARLVAGLRGTRQLRRA